MNACVSSLLSSTIEVRTDINVFHPIIRFHKVSTGPSNWETFLQLHSHGKGSVRRSPFQKQLENEYERKKLSTFSATYSFTLDPRPLIKKERAVLGIFQVSSHSLKLCDSFCVLQPHDLTSDWCRVLQVAPQSFTQYSSSKAV